MYIGYSDEHEALRRELRAYYDQLLTPEIVDELAHSEGVGPVARQVVRQMAADGWLGIGWPTEYGGQGKSQMEQFIFFDESMRSGAPVPMLTVNTVGPTIMNFGTQEQKDFFLPKILAGDLHFSIGYSEPEAGTDLASLRCRAELDGELAHPGRATADDLIRDNDVRLALDEITLRYRWPHVWDTPCLVAGQVAAALRKRGWQKDLMPCSPGCVVPLCTARPR